MSFIRQENHKLTSVYVWPTQTRFCQINTLPFINESFEINTSARMH